MRTYSRKRIHYEEIEGVEELCRLCLGKVEEPVPIFTEEAENVCATLPLRIMMCVGLEMTRDEYLSNVICKDCYKELDRLYTFRKKCEVTYQRLKSHVLAVKVRLHSQAMAVKDDGPLDVRGNVANAKNPPKLLTRKDVKQELVNIAYLNNVQLDSMQEFHLKRVEEINDYKEQNNEVQMQDITTTNSALPTEEFQATSSDFSLIMSTMLIELGVLRQEENGLVLADESLRTVELEGDDDTKVVLRLMEEDEVISAPTEVPKDIPMLPNNLETSIINDILPIPKIPEVSISKETLGKCKERRAPPVCMVCGKRFASHSGMVRHARVHSGERPHACRVCARRFAQRAGMLRHELVHKEIRPFKCTSCPKSFTQLGALRAHARTHQLPALALHACPHCDKLFLYASGLSRHMAVHTGRVRECGACGRAFNDCSSLRRHLRAAHPDRAGSAHAGSSARPARLAPKPAPGD